MFDSFICHLQIYHMYVLYSNEIQINFFERNLHVLIGNLIYRNNLTVPSSTDASILGTSPTGEKEKRRGGGLRNVLERIGNSYLVQRTLELQVVTRAIEGVSNTPIALEVAIEQLEGDLVIHIPPPPSDRLWYIF